MIGKEGHTEEYQNKHLILNYNWFSSMYWELMKLTNAKNLLFFTIWWIIVLKKTYSLSIFFWGLYSFHCARFFVKYRVYISFEKLNRIKKSYKNIFKENFIF